jgi:hypothetical protein
MIERDLQIHSTAEYGTVDVQPRGSDVCFALAPGGGHDFFMTVQAAGFVYKLCGRCGTIRIKDRYG